VCVNFTLYPEEKEIFKTTRKLTIERKWRSQGTSTWQIGGLYRLKPHVVIDGKEKNGKENFN
jgi:hypothetical protein